MRTGLSFLPGRILEIGCRSLRCIYRQTGGTHMVEMSQGTYLHGSLWEAHLAKGTRGQKSLRKLRVPGGSEC